MRARLLIGVGVVAALAGCSEKASRTANDASWTIPYGHEFWTRPTGASGLAVQDAIDRVRHAIRTSTGNAPRAVDSTFTATFAPQGLVFSPSGGPAVELHTANIEIGGRDVYDADSPRPAWRLRGNTAQSPLAAGILEHEEVLADGVELAWVVQRPVAGDLVVELAVGGMTYAGHSETGDHYADASNVARVRIGNATLVDARGTRTPIRTETIAGGLRWRVDEATLASAVFPVALDPAIGPEIAMDQPVLVSSGNQIDPAIACTATRCFVAWYDDLQVGILGTRVDPSTAAILDPDGVPLAMRTTSTQPLDPVLASNGTDFFFVWRQQSYAASAPFPSEIRGTRISASTGAVLDPAGLAIATGVVYRQHPSVASNGATYLVAWEQTAGYEHAFAARVANDGTLLDPSGIQVGSGNRHQYAPSVASNGTDFFIAWQDDVADIGDIYGARVTGAGAVLDPTPIGVSVEPNTQDRVAVASNGTGYLVAWSDERNGTDYDAYATRVTSAGVVVDPTGIVLAQGAGDQAGPAAASVGSDYLVAWKDRNLYINATRVTATGTVQDPAGIAVSLGLQPAVAADGTRYIVAWYEPRNHQDEDLFAARITTTGTVVDTSGFQVATTANAEGGVHVAASSSGFLVAWDDARGGSTSNGDIYAVRVSSAGDVLDPDGIAVTTAPYDQRLSSMASNGTDFFLVWADGRDQAGTDVYGARVLADGSIPSADTNGFPILVTNDGADNPSVASDGANYFVAWEDNRCVSQDAGNPNFPCNPAPGIYTSRVSAAGAVLDPGGVPLVTNPVGLRQYWPNVTSNAASYLVTWSDATSTTTGTNILGKLVSPAGTITSSTLAITTAQGSVSSAASNGTDFLVAWGASDGLKGTRVTATGTVLDPNGIAINSAPHGFAVASNGSDYLVAWQDFRGTTSDIYGARVRADGTIPAEDANGFAISTDPVFESQPTLAGGPAVPYLVAYSAGIRAEARLISVRCGDGVLDPGETCDDGGTVAGDGCSATCSIEAGYTCSGSPSQCTDIDECANGNGGCAQTCTNTQGSYTCSCDAGYTLAADGHGCDDIDECSAGAADCSTNATCTNTTGGFTCACNAGFAGDGVTCEAMSGSDGGHHGGGGGCNAAGAQDGLAMVLLVALGIGRRAPPKPRPPARRVARTQPPPRRPRRRSRACRTTSTRISTPRRR